MLRPSRPMMRPFISSLGRWTTLTVCSAVWSAATRCIAVRMMSRALSWASSRARALDGAGELDGVVLGLGANGLEEDATWRPRRSCPRRARGRRPGRRWPWPGPRGSCRARARARAACDRAARASPRAGRAARRAATRRRSWPASSFRRARASSSASRPAGASRPSPRGSAPSGGHGPRPRCGGLRPSRPSSSGMPTASGRRTPSTAPPTAATRATATRIGVSIRCPPIRTGLCGRTRQSCSGTIATREVAGPDRGVKPGLAPSSGRSGTSCQRAVIGRFPVRGTPSSGPGNVPVAYGRGCGGSTEC